MLHTVYHKFDKGARGKVSKIIFDEINRKLSGIVFETLSVGLRPPPSPEGKAFLFHGRTAKFVVKSKAETAPYAGAHQQKGRSTLDIQQLSNFVMTNLLYITGGLGVLVIVMYAIIINLALNVSYMKKRYRKMMTGVDGQNLERMLIGHLNEIQEVSDENAAIKREHLLDCARQAEEDDGDGAGHHERLLEALRDQAPAAESQHPSCDNARNIC